MYETNSVLAFGFKDVEVGRRWKLFSVTGKPVFVAIAYTDTFSASFFLTGVNLRAETDVVSETFFFV